MNEQEVLNSALQAINESMPELMSPEDIAKTIIRDAKTYLQALEAGWNYDEIRTSLLSGAVQRLWDLWDESEIAFDNSTQGYVDRFEEARIVAEELMALEESDEPTPE